MSADLSKIQSAFTVPEEAPASMTSLRPAHSINVLADPAQGKVYVQFAQPLPGMVLTYDQAMALSDMLTKQAFALRGISS